MKKPSLHIKYKSVLVVDDEPDLRKLVKETLEENIENIKVIESPEGLDALTRVNRQQFDLVITDIKMPKIDGLALVNHLRNVKEQFKPKNTLIISGHFDKSSPNLKGLAFLAKPFSLDVLNKRVQQLLDPKEPLSSAAFKLDVTFVNPFIEATLKVLEGKASTKAFKENVSVRSENHVSGDVSATVELQSSLFNGSMAIAFHTSTYLSIVSRMLGESHREINEQNRDCAREICSLIFESARKTLNESGYDIQSATPTLEISFKHKVKHAVEGPCLVVHFNTDVGPFAVETLVS